MSMKEIRVFTGEATERTGRNSGKTYKVQPAQAWVIDDAGMVVAYMQVDAFSDGAPVGTAEVRDLSLTFNEFGDLRSKARAWERMPLVEVAKRYPPVAAMLPAELRNTRQPAAAQS